MKNELPDLDTFERYITVSNALRHESTNNIYFDGDTGLFYEDPDTKKIIIDILWEPDYIPSELITHVFYITNWQKSVTYTM